VRRINRHAVALLDQADLRDNLRPAVEQLDKLPIRPVDLIAEVVKIALRRHWIRFIRC